MDRKSMMELLSIRFVTWNVATKYPEEDLHRLLEVTSCPDFYFIGLQEVKSQPQNWLINLILEDPWTQAFRESLKKRGYVKVYTQRLQGLVLNFFCQFKHLSSLRWIEARYTKTGFKGYWGNKGAVSIRFNVYGVNICVVDTHLTPHDHLLLDRISDYNTILKEHTFEAKNTSEIFFHDYVFWIGDLNFRLNAPDMNADLISLLVDKNQFQLLLEKDQLKQVMDNGEAFSELIENEITFPPTYKYEFHSQKFDLKRKPSWTDRILYKVNPDVYEGIKLRATQKTYKSHPSYVQSDHKPVTGQFDIVVKSEHPEDGIEFDPIPEWFINEQNFVSFKIIGNTKLNDEDWIGLFKDNFSSLDQYLVYEYVRPGLLHSNSHERISFSDGALRSPGMYRLVYITQKNDLIGILGISPPFPGHYKTT